MCRVLLAGHRPFLFAGAVHLFSFFFQVCCDGPSPLCCTPPVFGPSPLFDGTHFIGHRRGLSKGPPAPVFSPVVTFSCRTSQVFFFPPVQHCFIFACALDDDGPWAHFFGGSRGFDSPGSFRKTKYAFFATGALTHAGRALFPPPPWNSLAGAARVDHLFPLF